MKPIEYPTVRWARELPDHPALITGDSVVSYCELERKTLATTASLRSKAVTGGDRVIVCASNSVEWIVVAHALARLGAVLVPVSPRIGKSQSASFCRNYAPRLVLCDQITRSLWDDSVLLTDVVPERSGVSTHEIGSEIDPDVLHSIVQTSGSEGEPKGVCLTFRNHLSSALGSALNLGIRPNDRWLLNLPLDRIGGLAIIMRAAIYGTTVVVHERFDAARTWKAIDDDRVTQLSLVATTLRRLLDIEPERHCPSHVRSVLVGGGPVPKELIDEARERGFPILPTYGMTETASQIATLSPTAPRAKWHTAGTPLPLAELEIRDTAGMHVPPGIEGRVHVRGPMVTSGYWMNGEISHDSALLKDGWFATSDVGSLDEGGYLSVQGRVDNVIMSGGEKIHAEEIENALALHPAILRAVVVGQADREWGQTPVAFVELEPDDSVGPSEIMEFLSTRLVRHKLPRRIELVSELPILPSGKIDRQAVRCINAPELSGGLRRFGRN